MLKTCAKCKKIDHLSASHSIPMSFFRSILNRQDGGQLALIKNDAEKNQLTQNTGAYPILCKDCECWFNREYDQYIDRTLNTISSPDTIDDLRKPIYLKTETNRMSSFILSVFWRALISDNPFYESFELPVETSLALADLLFNRPREIRKFFSFSLHRLYFRTPSIEARTAEGFVMPPGVIQDASGRFEAWKFAGRGWLFTAYRPRLCSARADRLKCYRSDKNVIRTPCRDVLDDPDMFSIIRAGIYKDRSGHNKIRHRKNGVSVR